MNIRSTKIFHQNGSVNSSMLDSESIKMIKIQSKTKKKEYIPYYDDRKNENSPKKISSSTKIFRFLICMYL